MAPVASFHLLRFGRRDVLRALAHVPVDRRRLRSVSGCRFHKVLGTGSGRTMSASADLRRWATFAVWDDRRDLDAFLAGHPIPTTWWTHADERYDIVLHPIGGHGRWSGVDPLAGLVTSRPDDGPVAVVTRAAIRWRNIPAFLRAVPAVDDAADTTPGLLATVGIGEAPVARQATFSLWDSDESIRAFAYRDGAHSDVIERTRTGGWYGEEWFARFRPGDRSGTWNGADPLAGAGD